MYRDLNDNRLTHQANLNVLNSGITVLIWVVSIYLLWESALNLKGILRGFLFQLFESWDEYPWYSGQGGRRSS